MITGNRPNHCPKCKSTNIYLGNRTYKKDKDGEDTDLIISGIWFCNACGNVLGRKIGINNDIDNESI